MKKKLLMFIALGAMASCIKEIPSIPADIIFAEGTVTTPTFTSPGGTATITFSSTQAWVAEVEADKTWCIVSPTSGDAGAENTLTITATKNETGSERTAKITLISDKVTKKITATQLQNDSLTLAGVPKEDLPATENTFMITTAENMGAPAVGELPEWITFVIANATKGLTKTTITFTVNENITYDNREAKITITSGVKAEEFTINQLQTDSFTLEGKPTETFGINGASFKITATENTGEPKVGELPEWITSETAPATKGLTKTTITFTVKENTTYDNREAKITITSGDKIEEFTVSQLQINTFTLEGKPTAPIAPIENSFMITVTENMGTPTVGTLPEWIKVSTAPSAKGLTETKLMFIVKENPTYDSRGAKISITSGGKDVSFTVVQERNPNASINFQDAKFKAYLVARKGTNPEMTVVSRIDMNNDGEISYSEASVVTNIICDEHGISSLSEIEHFTALTTLDCSFNLLSTLDLSKNTLLKSLQCNNNQLRTIDISKNSLLKAINCSKNTLHTLDPSQNTLLGSLVCGRNQLTTLDISKNTLLTLLDCSENELPTLNVSKNTLLEFLDCANSQQSSLNVSKNTMLKVLKCSGNSLVTLDVSKNTVLEELYCLSMNHADGNNSLISIFKKAGQNIYIAHTHESEIIEVFTAK